MHSPAALAALSSGRARQSPLALRQHPARRCRPCRESGFGRDDRRRGIREIVGWSTPRSDGRRYDYLPFGEGLDDTYNGQSAMYSIGALPQPSYGQSMKFTSKERDSESGLDWFDTRYFSAAQGRYTSPDGMIAKKEWLSDPQRWNHYAYVRNNPLRYIDPKGEDLEVYYFYGKDLTADQRKYLQANMKQIQAAISEKFKKAGVRNVEFREGTKLTSKQIADIESKTPTGVVKLNFVSEAFRGTKFGSSTFGSTDDQASSAVALKNVFQGGFLTGPAKDDATRTFRLGEVASHELGHAVGFEAHPFINLLTLGLAGYFGSDIMDEQTGTPTNARFFDTGSERNKRIIDEINRVGDNTPRK
jgi:RHS repeat-associated protein